MIELKVNNIRHKQSLFYYEFRPQSACNIIVARGLSVRSGRAFIHSFPVSCVFE